MANATSRPYKRKIVYIHKTYQRNFILKSCLVALGAMLLASVLLYLLSGGTLTATYYSHHLALQKTSQAILPGLVVTNLIVLLCFLVATVVVTLYVSHKIGGPLYRLGKTLESIGEGDLKQRVNLRSRDQLKDFAEQLNAMLDSLQERARQVQNDVSALKEKVDAADNSPKDLKEDVGNLQETVNQLFHTE